MCAACLPLSCLATCLASCLAALRRWHGVTAPSGVGALLVMSCFFQALPAVAQTAADTVAAQASTAQSSTSEDSASQASTSEDSTSQDRAATTQSPEERIAGERGSLRDMERNLSISQERQQALRAEVEALDLDRAKITEDLITTTERINDLEDGIEEAGLRLAELTQSQAQVRNSLESRRATLAQLLAALQRLGVKPPPALAVSPDNALGAVRSALLMSSLMPEIQRETQALNSDIAELSAIKAEISSERTQLTADLATRAEDETRLSLLLEEKQLVRARRQQALEEEQQRAKALAESAESLRGLIASLENDALLASRAANQAAREAERAAQQAERARQAGPPKVTDFGRLSPAIAFADAKGLLPLPARGVILTKFGDIDAATGDPAEGITLATRSGARVISPADGRVAYAGPFRRYGDVLILDAGDDYHLLLAGVGRLDVAIGQFVLSGEPIGEMGERRLASATNLSLESAQPTLYIEIREQGTPVDPSPWWLRSNEEKESG